MDLSLSSIEIFIGAPIQHASERVALRRTVEFLSTQDIPAVILANIELTGRQIDLVVALDRAALVESKAFNSAIRGDKNGDWELRQASGRWKEIPNAYAQTYREKLALRDAMATFAGTAVRYPDAALIFVPRAA